ncbi:Pex24p-domain-containing protein [Aureobasidium sp. EXF-12298]|nr:Pex24p-domain-containing protein [Aureobasidium sp. EXF-12298]KAI4760383.1 Pex24p-domain-containing protein [Aureobasidium sp. EXF-12344]KAI4772366.1 Pex24p-domain-containing protein [Aureobasidium sp. EXF-3400]
MDNYAGTPMVNRDEPIPVIQIPFNTDDTAPPETEQQKLGRRERIKQEAERLKGKLQDVSTQYKTTQGSVQERLFNTLLEQVFPQEAEDDGTPKKDRRSRQYVDKPQFSLPVMSANFRRFNARIGIVFVFQNQMIRLFTWRVPTHTLSFLAVYTLVCLQPALAPVVPLAALLFFVMIPSFLTRHPPPPVANPSSSVDAAAAEQYAAYGYSGPAVAPPQRVKPAPEMSKDFFRNMRDLQNCMEDFSRVHDGAVSVITPYTDFSNERLSSAVFLCLTALVSIAFLAAHLVPWRAILLVAGWAATSAGHPRAQEIIINAGSLAQIQLIYDRICVASSEWVESDIVLDEPAEVREVEIFELQRLQKHSLGGDEGAVLEGEWEPWLFTPQPYAPTSPSRIAGARPIGTQFFEDVQPPLGWLWRDKKWTLDLGSREWVEERCVSAVEIETEGERWVYDLETPDSKIKSATLAPPKSWEEGPTVSKKGEWRRRRWVRLVERKIVKVSPED